MKQETTLILNAGRDIAAVLHKLDSISKRHVVALLDEITITAAAVEGVSRDELEQRLKELRL